MAAFKDELPTVDGLEPVHKPTPPHPDLVTPPNQSVEALKDISFGSIAGVLGKFVEYPFDTVKVRLQSQTTELGPHRLRGPLDAFSAAFRAPEGPLVSLYRGISAPLLGAAIETSSLFFSYRIAQDIIVANSASLRLLRDQNGGKIELPFSYLLGCGAASGAFTSLLLTPIELVKCKMQVPIPPSDMAAKLGYTSAQPPGPLALVRTIFRTQGILGFWHGQLGTLIRETGGSAAWFGSYEGVKMLFLKYDPSVSQIADVKVWQQMCAGAAAGMSYNFVFYPADTIKSRMQTSVADAAVVKKMTFASTGRQLWREQGLKGFYRGCGITVFRSAPSSAIIFSIYETLRKYFG
ncbi:solute carrier family 25, member 46 [Capronia epimyces CBS 606.96]|uniref:Solute carrier family 25, member 46 n=1 Tax=Capronia epimyces CBS 606.96 TaxID=1182542 RepID=W9XM17_9EURO|nr:solute carrier family 25, member 46 [Capronia epimyces CBS 606.96]EXJ78345.1 solute carrier family 25, member 46 [Capronia epimyces CBS 606.96]